MVGQTGMFAPPMIRSAGLLSLEGAGDNGTTGSARMVFDDSRLSQWHHCRRPVTGISRSRVPFLKLTQES